MKVIFLDFDGVLNSFHDSPNDGQLILAGFQDPKTLDAVFIKRLNKIVKQTGADVVVSSAWRMKRDGEDRTAEELQDILDSRGFEGKVIGITEHLFRHNQTRADEIQKWLDDCEEDVYSFVVLDDMWKNAMKDRFWHNFIFIEKNAGLQKRHVKRAIQILERAKE